MISVRKFDVLGQYFPFVAPSTDGTHACLVKRLLKLLSHWEILFFLEGGFVLTLFRLKFLTFAKALIIDFLG